MNASIRSNSTFGRLRLIITTILIGGRHTGVNTLVGSNEPDVNRAVAKGTAEIEIPKQHSFLDKRNLGHPKLKFNLVTKDCPRLEPELRLRLPHHRISKHQKMFQPEKKFKN